MIDVLRPAAVSAIKPDQIPNVIGTKALHDFKYGQELRWTDLGSQVPCLSSGSKLVSHFQNKFQPKGEKMSTITKFEDLILCGRKLRSGEDDLQNDYNRCTGKRFWYAY